MPDFAPTLTLDHGGAEGYNPTAVLISDIPLSEAAPAPLTTDFSATVGGNAIDISGVTIINGGSQVDIVMINIEEHTGDVLLSFSNASGNCRSATDDTPANPFTDMLTGTIA